MSEWLNSKVFKRWFWKEIWSNFREWRSDAPVVVKVTVGTAVAFPIWLYLASYISDPKPWIRGSGVFLQLFGFVLAAYGLEQTLEKFGQTPSTSRILPWFGDFWSVFDTSGDTVQLSPDGLAHAHGIGELSVKSTPQTLEERVGELENQLAEVKDEMGEVRQHLNEEIERLEGEVEAVEEDVEEMREKVKEVNVGEGALWLEWCGVSLFVYGVPLASFPSLFLPAYRILAVPVLAGGLLGLLHWLPARNSTGEKPTSVS